MAITAAQVNALRQKTGTGLMDCKKALTEAEGDIDKAIEILRKKGQKVSELRAGKAANEGLVVAATSGDGKSGVTVHLSSETDFVAKNEEFVAFAKNLAQFALQQQPSSIEELKGLQMNGRTVGEAVLDLVGKINERIELANYSVLTGDEVVAYNHAGNKIGVLVALNKSGNDSISEVGRDIAMQVAAMNPVALDENGVPQDVIDRELEIGREQARQEGKPDTILEKIAEGKLKKYFKENTLLNQQFVKDGSKTVAQALKEADSELAVLNYSRVALGN